MELDIQGLIGSQDKTMVESPMTLNIVLASQTHRYALRNSEMRRFLDDNQGRAFKDNQRGDTARKRDYS